MDLEDLIVIDNTWRLVNLLTVRERMVYKDMINMLSTKEIAKKHGIRPRTAKANISNIYRKLNVSTEDLGDSPRLQFIKKVMEYKPKKGCEA